MAKKRSKKAPDVKASAERIWLAGLGALSMAESESSRFFSSLVEKGRGAMDGEGKIGQIKSRASSAGSSARKRAGGRMEWLQSTIDERVEQALGAMGLATQREVKQLTKRIDALTRKVDTGATRKKAPRKKAAKKTTRKKR